MGELVTALRALTLLTSTTATWGALALLSVRQLSAASAPGPDAWLIDAAAVLTLSASSWLMVLMLAELAARLSTGRSGLRHRFLPGHRAVGLLVAATLGAAPAAQAAELTLPAPDRAPLPATTGTPVAERTGAPQHGVTVRPGDSLWRISAERLLPAGASAPMVQRTVDSLYDLNQRAIGPDPDRIQPGTRLVTPAHHREEPA